MRECDWGALGTCPSLQIEEEIKIELYAWGIAEQNQNQFSNP